MKRTSNIKEIVKKALLSMSFLKKTEEGIPFNRLNANAIHYVVLREKWEGPFGAITLIGIFDDYWEAMKSLDREQTIWGEMEDVIMFAEKPNFGKRDLLVGYNELQT